MPPALPHDRGSLRRWTTWLMAPSQSPQKRGAVTVASATVVGADAADDVGAASRVDTDQRPRVPIRGSPAAARAGCRGDRVSVRTATERDARLSQREESNDHNRVDSARRPNPD